ncbi:hypothetical protein, partial [Amnibacterium sp.]|uniref:hypothetical protein n=1 Tax=Amnibacterium sp. TaxID=1872496 RepID=UPI003F7B93C4
MSARSRLPLLPLALGITDGILNALTLGAGAVLRGAGGIDFGLALRVGVAALVTAGFTMFVADYAARREDLVRAARELNLTEPGRGAGRRRVGGRAAEGARGGGGGRRGAAGGRRGAP